MNPVVMLPGWGLGAAVFTTLAERLSSRCAASVIDLPGYGTAPAPEPYTLETVAEAIAARAPARCSVVGWSLGAQIALDWARARPQQVRRLALIAATPSFVQRADWRCAMEPAVFDSFAAALRRERRGTLERFVTLQAHGDAAAKRVARELRTALSRSVVAPQDVLERSLAILETSDLRAMLAAVAQPALVVHGECDRLVPVAAGEHLARALPDATLATIAGAAHAPFVSGPDRVADRLASFFDE